MSRIKPRKKAIRDAKALALRNILKRAEEAAFLEGRRSILSSVVFFRQRIDVTDEALAMARDIAGFDPVARTRDEASRCIGGAIMARPDLVSVNTTPVRPNEQNETAVTNYEYTVACIPYASLVEARSRTSDDFISHWSYHRHGRKHRYAQINEFIQDYHT